MKRFFNLLIPLSIVAVALTGCVVVPAGYYGPRVVVAPAPVVVVRPYR
jgi:hypothetical protein